MSERWIPHNTDTARPDVDSDYRIIQADVAEWLWVGMQGWETLARHHAVVHQDCEEGGGNDE